MSVQTTKYIPPAGTNSAVTENELNQTLQSYITVSSASASFLPKTNPTTNSLIAGTGSFTNFIFSGATGSTASTGGITLPATAAGFITIKVGATNMKLPYFNI